MTDAKADDDEKFINALANDIRKDNNVNMCNDNSGDITCEDGGEW
eukprot:CAMPEP_0114657998 /NCGR_PEP_ID=MMETSP0191-20121206/14935_1 /TAXON_ID=126664 /ORGANISM="Sorites sp." /LENGTH=44 /DNA_ID= /DNA_START= /DNA_END= /DNA_ORIENTATION=